MFFHHTKLIYRTSILSYLILLPLFAFLLFSSTACRSKKTPKKKRVSASRPTSQMAKKRIPAKSKTLSKRTKVPAKRIVPKKKTPKEMLKYLRKPPKGFVDLRKAIPGLRFSIGYHRTDNFTKAPLPGYGAPGAWMLKYPASRLRKVQKAALKRGLSILVYDAYRPYRGTLAMVAWAKRIGRYDELVKGGYIARHSGHNRGHTIDLTLFNIKTGKILDMGTPWDTLSTKSHTRNAKGQVLRNRLLLRRLMRRYGFRPYYKEWWHFGFRMKGTRPLNVPYGCFEAPDGKWKAQKGWDKSGFKMPMEWKPSACKDLN